MKPKFIDHIVLIVQDVQKTAEFHIQFLGEPIQRAKEQVAFKVGDTKVFFGLPYQDWKEFNKDAGGLNHIAFGVRTVEELQQFHDLLDARGIKNSGITVDKYGGKEFIWFDDPDGYRREFYYRSE